MRYLFDANVFIEAKNRYYAFDICPGFWDWMDSVCTSAADVGSIRSVRDELIAGNDELAEWAKNRQDAPWFLKVDDEDTQRAFATIAAHVTADVYSAPAQSKFLAGADPWLIAKAKVVGATVVTHELPEPMAKKRVPIPNVCGKFGVPFINTFDTLRQFATTFGWRPTS